MSSHSFNFLSTFEHLLPTSQILPEPGRTPLLLWIMTSVSLLTTSIYAYAATMPNGSFSITSSSARRHIDQSSCMTYVHAAHVHLPGAEHWETTWLPAATRAASTQLPAKTSAKPWCTRKREQISSTFKMRFAIWQICRENPQYETEFKILT